jgi:ABC-type transporter Mla subunit MlaD
MAVDWNVIIEMVLAIAGIIGFGTIAMKMKLDAEKLIEKIKALVSSYQSLVNEIKQANDDGEVSQKEFTQLMNEVNALVANATEAMKAGKDVIDDVELLRNQIMAIVAKNQLKTAINENMNN